MRARLGVLLAPTVLLAACHAEPSPACFAVRGRWRGERVISYRLEAESGALAPAEFARSIRAALDEWAATGCASFHEARVDETPALSFSWANDAHGDCVPFGADPSLAHAGPVGPDTFVHFDSERAWTSPVLRQAALHEIGHVLGLDHSSDEAAVMYAEPSPARRHLAPSDLAGIHSLYGGGASARGDLVVTRNRTELVLHSVAPPELCDWTLFDTDGDGDAEIVTWRTDAAGAMCCYHFADGPALVCTLGPLYGLSGQGSELELLCTPDGERLLILRPERGEPVVRAFDAQGMPRSFDGQVPIQAGVGASSRPQRGDLDGDGTLETVTRRE
jgi:hypothetical protein